ncbi:hypothetical protein D5086_008185 [Populus alba]|uniref:Uncharacterized protein n=1 Tax=Populus alba TaxID=43335 RepID=A0ACC4CF97_POPAL
MRVNQDLKFGMIRLSLPQGLGGETARWGRFGRELGVSWVLDFSFLRSASTKEMVNCLLALVSKDNSPRYEALT